VLQTRFLSQAGTAVLTDLMPLATNSRLRPAHEVIRTVECARGEIELEVAFVPRAKYALQSLKILTPAN
jgi:hypothetical protein